jgi:caa(3)-type oxidase subunit IV
MTPKNTRESTRESVSRRPYLYVFLALCVLTVAEVAVVLVPGIRRELLISALVVLAIAKAGLVLMYFMHLSHETTALKLTVMIPFVLPAAYAMVLVAEAAWRYLP